MALSLALHGLALVPLLLAGMAGSSASDEPALMVELSLAAPTPGPASEAEARESAEPQQPPEPETPAVSVEHAAASLPPPEPQPEIALEPEIKVELPPPQEVPPVQTAELKPADPPKPRPKPPAAKPSAPRPNAASAWTHAPVPDAGIASTTQQASAASMVVFEGKPRYRYPPTPPVYPQRSIELNQQGEALVRVRLDPNGSAAEIVLWRGSGFPLLDRAALTAVRGWHFLPAVRDGRPVAAWVEIPVRFHLR